MKLDNQSSRVLNGELQNKNIVLKRRLSNAELEGSLGKVSLYLNKNLWSEFLQKSRENQNLIEEGIEEAILQYVP